jgi:hypothetical protein
MGYLGYKPADKPLTAADITDSIITSAKIVDGTIVNADINASAAIVSTKLSGAANTPAFMAFNDGSTTQSISNSTWTEITNYNTELFDSDSAFNNTTCRYTPQVAGKYFFTAQIFVSGGSAATFNAMIIGKNGGTTFNSTSEVGWLSALAVGAGDFRVNGILTMNGTSDYVSVLINQQTGGSKTIGGGSGASLMFFGGYRLIGA